MQRRLPLTGVEADWRLDEHTRAAGRRGVEEARRALRQAAVRQLPGRSRHHKGDRSCQDGLPCTAASAPSF